MLKIGMKMLLLVFLLTFHERSTFGSSIPESLLIKRAEVQDWLDMEYAKGRERRNYLPSGLQFQYCSGAGCPCKTRLQFSEDEIQAALTELSIARKKYNCEKDTAACERLGLQYAVRKLEMTVKGKLTSNRSNINKICGVRDSGGQNDWIENAGASRFTTRDCVDGAVNGMSFLFILGHYGVMKHHRIIVPGLIHVPTPHFFTRLEEFGGGGNWRFDLYHSNRMAFDKLPGVVETR